MFTSNLRKLRTFCARSIRKLLSTSRTKSTSFPSPGPGEKYQFSCTSTLLNEFRSNFVLGSIQFACFPFDAMVNTVQLIWRLHNFTWAHKCRTRPFRITSTKTKLALTPSRGLWSIQTVLLKSKEPTFDVVATDSWGYRCYFRNMKYESSWITDWRWNVTPGNHGDLWNATPVGRIPPPLGSEYCSRLHGALNLLFVCSTMSPQKSSAVEHKYFIHSWQWNRRVDALVLNNCRGQHTGGGSSIWG